MTERKRPHPLLIAMAAVCAALIVLGVALELIGGDGHRHSVTEHTGTLLWTPKARNPDPDLGSRYWTLDYPAAYASRVKQGVGVYFEDERIGFVHSSEIDHGTVWVYLWVAPEYAKIADGITESEPIETPEGPRIQIYKYKTAPSPNATRT